MFSRSSFSVSSFSGNSFALVKRLVEETIRIMFGGSGWNFDVEDLKITGKNKLDEDIIIEDEEIIEFLTVFAMWRSAQSI